MKRSYSWQRRGGWIEAAKTMLRLSDVGETERPMQQLPVKKEGPYSVPRKGERSGSSATRGMETPTRGAPASASRRSAVPTEMRLFEFNTEVMRDYFTLASDTSLVLYPFQKSNLKFEMWVFEIFSTGNFPESIRKLAP